jgi:hypothetical protein
MSSTNLLIFPGSTSGKPAHTPTPNQNVVTESDANNLAMVPVQRLALMLSRDNSVETKSKIRGYLCHYDFSQLEYSTTTTKALFKHQTALRLSFIVTENVDHLLEAARIATFLARLENSRPRDVHHVNFGDSTRRAISNLVNFYRLAFNYEVIDNLGKEVLNGDVIDVMQVISLGDDHAQRDWNGRAITVKRDDLVKSIKVLKKLAGIR